MNVMTLIRQHPLLHADLANLGLNSHALNTAAARITEQLGGDSDHNLCFVLSALDCQDFVSLVDVADVAGHAGLSNPLAQSLVFILAPWVGKFCIDTPGLPDPTLRNS